MKLFIPRVNQVKMGLMALMVHQDPRVSEDREDREESKVTKVTLV